MKRVRYLTLAFAVLMAVAVAALWQMVIMAGDLAELAGVAALVLLLVSLRSPRSPRRWRLLVGGWVVFAALMEAASIKAFISNAEPALSWGFVALTLGGVVAAIWAFLQQRRSRGRYFSGYFQN